MYYTVLITSGILLLPNGNTICHSEINTYNLTAAKAEKQAKKDYHKKFDGTEIRIVQLWHEVSAFSNHDTAFIKKNKRTLSGYKGKTSWFA